MKQKILNTIASVLISSSVMASDIAKDIRAGGGLDLDDGGYFELGVAAGYVNLARITQYESEGGFVGLDLAGEYSYKGVFIELVHGTYDGLNLGYNFLNTSNWSFDLILSSISGLYHNNDSSALTEAEMDIALVERDTLYNGAGLRATRYWQDYIFQYRLVTDIHDNNGIRSTARLARNWQVKNWNFHAIVSADYAAEKTNQYLFGIAPDDATTRFPTYLPKASLAFSVETGVTYPLTENWVWRSSVRYTPLPEEIRDSPLTDDGHAMDAVISISYVF